MIISSTQIQSVMKAYNQNKTAKTGNSQGGSSTSRKDEVILSSEAQGFGQIYQAVKAVPAVRQDKVQDISGRIANGSYNVDASDVAEKMLGRTVADQMK
jgi:negative regulator of flagellin synthesis FlgM